MIEILSFCVGIVIGVFFVVPNYNASVDKQSAKKDSSAIFYALFNEKELKSSKK